MLAEAAAAAAAADAGNAFDDVWVAVKALPEPSAAQIMQMQCTVVGEGLYRSDSSSNSGTHLLSPDRASSSSSKGQASAGSSIDCSYLAAAAPLPMSPAAAVIANAPEDELDSEVLLEQWIEQELTAAGVEAVMEELDTTTTAGTGAAAAPVDAGSPFCQPDAAAAAAPACATCPAASFTQLSWQQQQAAAAHYEAAAAALGDELVHSILDAAVPASPSSMQRVGTAVPASACSMLPMGHCCMPSSTAAAAGALGGLLQQLATASDAAAAACRHASYSFTSSVAVPAAALPEQALPLTAVPQHAAAAPAPALLAQRLAELYAEFENVSQELQCLQQQQQQVGYGFAAPAAAPGPHSFAGTSTMPGSAVTTEAAFAPGPVGSYQHALLPQHLTGPAGLPSSTVVAHAYGAYPLLEAAAGLLHVPQPLLLADDAAWLHVQGSSSSSPSANNRAV